MNIEIRPLESARAAAIEALLDLAFGADRHRRTAYRVRLGLSPIAALSMTAWRNDALAGSTQCWPVALATAGGDMRPLVMVGPVAVDPALQGTGIGKAMLHEVARRLDAAGHDAVLIGDAPYYAPFGFVAGPARGWTLPGPFSPDRLLLRAAAPGDWPERGELGPRPFALEDESA